MDALESIGFEEVRITQRYEPFKGSSKEKTTIKYGVVGINVLARKP